MMTLGDNDRRDAGRNGGAEVRAVPAKSRVEVQVRGDVRAIGATIAVRVPGQEYVHHLVIVRHRVAEVVDRPLHDIVRSDAGHALARLEGRTDLVAGRPGRENPDVAGAEVVPAVVPAGAVDVR